MGASVYPRAFRDRLAADAPFLLDGATGTELERRGARCTLPLWSAHALVEAPALVEAIHRDYARAGAEVLVANTFRSQRRTLARGGLAERTEELTRLAVALARRALPARGFVAGSIAPLEDCWRPDLTPSDDALASEHAEHAAHLARAGADLLLVETQNTIREAVAATRAARATPLPVWVSFACDATARLASGEPLGEALRAVAPLAPDLVGVNCLPPAHVAAALPILRASGLLFAVYANLGAPIAGERRARSHDASPDDYAAHAAGWLAAGARGVGGCCGTTPAHVQAIAARLTQRASR
jgi:S-methylmethionine-dependent homocysteine/selenocysteine methylase